MWIMTPYGFFSIVRPVDAQGNPHPTDMLIRARDRSHLVALRKRWTLPAIKATGGTDYPYRITTTREVVGQFMIDFVLNIDYPNFKEEAHRVRPDDWPYTNFLLRVWAFGRELTHGKVGRNAKRLNDRTLFDL